MTALATEPQAPARPYSGAVVAHMANRDNRVEDYVFFTTVLGMTPLGAYCRVMDVAPIAPRNQGEATPLTEDERRRLETAELTIRRWTAHMAAHPAQAVWRAAKDTPEANAWDGVVAWEAATSGL